MKKLFYDMPHHSLWPELTEMNCRSSTLTLFPPPIKVPFPPPINAQDIVHKRPTSKICSKGPNAFFIYRKAYFDQLALLNRRFKMTDVSKLVSLNWKKERGEVKEAYKKIAQEVECKLNERRKRDLVYDSNLKISRRKNNIHKKKKKRGKVTYDQKGSVTCKKDKAANRRGGTHFELTFGSDMQPLIHSYNADFERYYCTPNDVVSDEPIVANDDESILDQNDVNSYVQNDIVLGPTPAQSQNDQSPVENDGISNLLNTQDVAFDEFCFDDNTNLNWYLQNFVI